MISQKPSLGFHPLVRRWMKNRELGISSRPNPMGYFVKPGDIDRYPNDFKFTLEDLGKDLEKINAVYGTRFDDEFADVKTKGNISLRQIAEKIEEVRAIRKVFFEVGNLSCESAYVGGIRIPKRDFLYVEFSRADMGLDHEYVKGGMTPSLSSDYSFIPIARKYRPR